MAPVKRALLVTSAVTPVGRSITASKPVTAISLVRLTVNSALPPAGSSISAGSADMEFAAGAAEVQVTMVFSVAAAALVPSASSIWKLESLMMDVAASEASAFTLM